jgi:F-type H+-transporting ATPase subunit a
LEKALEGASVVFEIFGIPITETIVSTWIVMAVIIIGAYLITRNFNKLPSGAQNVAEALVEGINDFTVQTMGEKNRWFAAYAGTLIVFIFFANISGLFGLWPPTADTGTTIGLGVMTFFIIQYQGIKNKGIGTYLKNILLEPIPIIFAPMNIISELATPVSLAFRLFGNILAGVVVMGLIYSVVPVGIPIPLHIYFDLFAGLLQSFIFTMLTMVFVSMATETE